MPLKKLHLLLGILAAMISGFIIPALSAYSGYSRSIEAVDQKINDFRLESARTYPDKVQFEAMNLKLDRISEDVGQIKGYLKAKGAESFSSR